MEFLFLPRSLRNYPIGVSRYATCLKGLKRLKGLKGILANRLPPVIEIIPRPGYRLRSLVTA